MSELRTCFLNYENKYSNVTFVSDDKISFCANKGSNHHVYNTITTLDAVLQQIDAGLQQRDAGLQQRDAGLQ